jgi:hypothetical protein
MSNGGFHMRKLFSIGVSLFVVAGVMTAVPASAATISNGVKCTKLNQTTTVSGRKYKCAKNPMITNAKKTWLSNDCLIAANNFVKAKKDTAALAAKYAAQIPELELNIISTNSLIAEIQVKLDKSILNLSETKDKLAKVLLLTVPTDAGAAAKLAQAKIDLGTAINAWTAAIKAYTSQIKQLEGSAKFLEASKLAAINKPAQLAPATASSKETALLICTKGL